MTDTQEVTPMKMTAIHLPAYMLDWLKAQPGGMAEKIRNLVEVEMEKETTHSTEPTAA